MKWPESYSALGKSVVEERERERSQKREKPRFEARRDGIEEVPFFVENERPRGWGGDSIDTYCRARVHGPVNALIYAYVDQGIHLGKK